MLMLATCTLNTYLKEANWETEGFYFLKILRKHMAEWNSSTGHSDSRQQSPPLPLHKLTHKHNYHSKRLDHFLLIYPA